VRHLTQFRCDTGLDITWNAADFPGAFLAINERQVPEAVAGLSHFQLKVCDFSDTLKSPK
jgi:hypothetical protein